MDVNPSQPICSHLQPEDSSSVRNYHTPFTIDESAVDSAVVITADKMEVSTGVRFSNSNVGLQFVDGTAMTSANAYQSRVDSLETAIQAFETAIANAKASLSAVAISGDAADLVGGQNGDSAYDLWLADGNSGSESDYLASLVGTTGATGAAGAPGAAGTAGQDGSSAHDLWVADGNSGSVADYLESLKGGAFPPSLRGELRGHDIFRWIILENSEAQCGVREHKREIENVQWRSKVGRLHDDNRDHHSPDRLTLSSACQTGDCSDVVSRFWLGINGTVRVQAGHLAIPLGAGNRRVGNANQSRVASF